MILSIITINRNNASGLEKTMQSVLDQTYKDFEYIVIDGASTDQSVPLIKQLAENHTIRWVSEPDKGIYNAMNKGIQMANGEYIMILNSGDYLVSNHVIEQMHESLIAHSSPKIFYGNIIKIWTDGRTIVDKQLREPICFYDFYRGTLNPDGTWIKRELFDEYGYFDESMRICSDWAWFLNAIGLHSTQAKHTDIDAIYFDMTGVSESGEKSRITIQQERRKVLENTLPAPILADYDRFHPDILIMRRIHRHPWAFKLVCLLERILFKTERLLKH